MGGKYDVFVTYSFLIIYKLTARECCHCSEDDGSQRRRGLMPDGIAGSACAPCSGDSLHRVHVFGAFILSQSFIIHFLVVATLES